MRERAKRLRPCQCKQAGAPDCYPAGCTWGNCTEWRCRACRKLYFSVGTPGCPCSGYLRWLRYPGMDNPTRHWDPATDEVAECHVPVKPSRARRLQGGRHNRKRALYCERL